MLIVLAPSAMTASMMRHRKSVLRRKLDVVGVLPRLAHGCDRGFHHLVGRHAQLVLHVDRRSREEGVNAAGISRFDGFAGTLDIDRFGARQPADRAVLDDFGDCFHRFEITVAGDRKSGLDDVDFHQLQRPGNADFFVSRHRRARALLSF
jgi:hypothetical protein